MASSLLPLGSAGFLLAARILESGRQKRARQYQHRATTRMRLSEYLTTLMLPPTARLDNQPPQRPRRLHSTQLWVLLKYDPTGARSPGCPDRPAAQEEGPAGLSRWSCSSLDSQRRREMWVRSIVQAVNGQVRVAVGGQVKVSIPWLVFSCWCGVLLSGLICPAFSGQRIRG